MFFLSYHINCEKTEKNIPVRVEIIPVPVAQKIEFEIQGHRFGTGKI